MKKFLLILLLVLAVGGAAYFAVTTFFPKEQGVPAEETPAQIVYKITSVERTATLPGDLVPQSAANEFLVLKVKGANYDIKTRPYNVFYFTFTDEAGNVYQNALNTLPDSLRYGTLDPDVNNPVAGSIVFEIPKKTSGKLIVTDEKNNPIQTITVK